MNIFIIIALCMIVITTLIGVYVQSKRVIDIGLPYLREPQLFTDAERAFLHVLEHAIGDEYRIFAKVRVADVICVESGLAPRIKRIASNKIRAKHFDFILCNKADLSVVCAIELDDRNHQKKNREEHDKFLASVCERVFLPLVKIPAKEGYPITHLRNSILAAIGIPDATAIATPSQRSGRAAA
ncbi:MAG: DUF2726 domain-containing protein [Undibacterium sp.]|nr:DUF2726 domain-containing protein [Undibacterium sp.]